MTDSLRLVNGEELYDLASDPGQQQDLALERPDEVARMRSAYEKWWAEVSGPATEYVEIPVGHPEGENPTRLTSFDWRPNGGPPNQAVMQRPLEESGLWAPTVFGRSTWRGRVAIGSLCGKDGRKRITPPGIRARLQVGDLEQQQVIEAGAREVHFELELAGGFNKTAEPPRSERRFLSRRLFRLR